MFFCNFPYTPLEALPFKLNALGLQKMACFMTILKRNTCLQSLNKFPYFAKHILDPQYP